MASRSGRKVAFITGGAQGIGKATAIAALSAGMEVAILDRDRRALGEASRELAPLGEVLALGADVSDETQVRRAIGAACRRFGGIDLLVNDAGYMLRKQVTRLTLKEWNGVIGTHLTGAFLCAKHAAPSLVERGGSIVNIASTRALMSEPDTESYSAAKGGLVALTHALALSLGPAVRVNCISPGWIDTSAWKKKAVRKAAALSRQDHAQHPAGRVGRPEDIAAAILFLAGPDSGFVTGANLVVDGGMTRKMIYA
ncbi:MAG: SDR family oxidoreductase [Alphaproteobacteria bacterium]|nr:SDR family oxidoreductase [Alphaproteobacteria bacterium]